MTQLYQVRCVYRRCEGVRYDYLTQFLPYEAPDVLAQHSLAQQAAGEASSRAPAKRSRLQHPCTAQVFTAAHIQGLIPECLIYIP